MTHALEPLGETAVLFHTDENGALSPAVAAEMFRSLFTSSEASDIVPGSRSVVVTLQPGLSADQAMDRIATLLTTSSVTEPAPDSEPAVERRGFDSLVEIPVVYDGEDVAEAAKFLGVSVPEVIARHCTPVYTVAFLGFAPGFPYLTGVDPVLAPLPRRSTPRTSVPAGSVAVAAGMSCVYPSSGPGGWNLLGHTSVTLFDPANSVRPSLLLPGDLVKFVQIGDRS